MAGFTDAIRGDGLARAQRALAALDGDPLRLDRERQRFNNSPPPYRSDRSGTTTLSASPDPPSEEQRRRQQRRVQLGRQREASEPYHQFEDQVEEERRRIWNADPSTNWISIGIGDGTFEEEASETIKKRWVEQGIWNNKWNQFASGLWKHEKPLELESESETDAEAGFPAPLFTFAPTESHPKPRRPKSDVEKRRIAERRVVQEHEREASRPYHQFIYQISKERERIEEESENGEGANVADINTRAYERVKTTWTKRGIWSGRWGILPGMSWKHEVPLEEETADDPPPVQENPLANGNHEAPEAAAVRTFGSPSLVESNHRQASSALNSSEQGPPADIDSAGLENGDAEHSSSTSNSPPPRSGKRILRPTTAQALLPIKRKPPHKDGQPANASLGSVLPSKVSKAARKRKGPRRRLNISQKVPTDGLPLSCSVDAAESQASPPPGRVTPRRSKRIQPSVSSVVKDPAKAAFTDPSKRAVPSKPERKVASNRFTMSSAKPQGVSKRQPAETTRRKALIK